MKIIYLIILIAATLGLIADVVLRYVEKIKNFNIDKKIFDIQTETVPIGKFLPENVTMLLVAVMAASAAGVLTAAAGLHWYLSLPCGISAGMSVCFAAQYLGKNALEAITLKNLPKGGDAAGMSGYCVETLEPGGIGKVRFTHKGREFVVYAGIPDAEEAEIKAGESVIAVYEQDGYYFVTTADEIYKGIDTNF